MKVLHRFYNLILGFFSIRRKVNPTDIPSRLPKEALERVMSEAQFLRSTYEVEIKEARVGEIPLPRRADQPEN